MLRSETKVRARALQLLYAWELQDRPNIAGLSASLAGWGIKAGSEFLDAEDLASRIAAAASALDDEILRAADNWRFDRIGVVERNILRIALYEMEQGDIPPRVAINEAVRLAHWFAGPRAPAFVNGVLDGLARDNGLL